MIAPSNESSQEVTSTVVFWMDVAGVQRADDGAMAVSKLRIA